MGILLFGVATVNSSNNLLYIILAFVLSLMILSGLTSSINIQFIEIEIRPSGFYFKNHKGLLTLRIKNASFLPKFALQIRANGNFFRSGSVFVGFVSRKHNAQTQLEITPIRRGSVSLESLTISSFFPFGFTERQYKINVDMEIMVFPDINSTNTGVQFERKKSEGAGVLSWKTGRGGDFQGLSEYSFGESLYHIHWRKSYDQIYTKKYGDEMRKGRMIVLPQKWNENTLDSIATMVNNLIKNGKSVGIKTPDITIYPSAGMGQAYRIYAQLASLPFKS